MSLWLRKTGETLILWAGTDTPDFVEGPRDVQRRAGDPRIFYSPRSALRHVHVSAPKHLAILLSTNVRTCVLSLSKLSGFSSGAGWVDGNFSRLSWHGDPRREAVFGVKRELERWSVPRSVGLEFGSLIARHFPRPPISMENRRRSSRCCGPFV